MPSLILPDIIDAALRPARIEERVSACGRDVVREALRLLVHGAPSG